MVNFESLGRQNNETRTSLEFQIRNIQADIEALENRMERERDKAIKTSLESQIKIKESKLYDLVKKIRDFKERKDGIGHA